MSDECHAVLKAYAAFFGFGMGDILYMFARQEIHQHAVHCQFVSGLLSAQGISIDKRTAKPCWGHACLVCVHESKCKCGLTDEKFMPHEMAKQYFKPDSPHWNLYKT